MALNNRGYQWFNWSELVGANGSVTPPRGSVFDSTPPIVYMYLLQDVTYCRGWGTWSVWDQWETYLKTHMEKMTARHRFQWNQSTDAVTHRTVWCGSDLLAYRWGEMVLVILMIAYRWGEMVLVMLMMVMTKTMMMIIKKLINCLQADIQKVLRNARKLPEKQQHFYKVITVLLYLPSSSPWALRDHHKCNTKWRHINRWSGLP